MGGNLKPIRVLGHPAHAPLTHFPLALWTAGFGGDLLYVWAGDPFWWRFAFWNIALGLAVGGLTVVTGFYDFLFIPEEKPRAVRAATLHMTVMLTAASLFTASLYFHGIGPPLPSHRIPALVLSGLGVLCLHGGGWLGGQLVYRHGIGYDGPHPGSEKVEP